MTMGRRVRATVVDGKNNDGRRGRIMILSNEE